MKLLIVLLLFVSCSTHIKIHKRHMGESSKDEIEDMVKRVYAFDSVKCVEYDSLWDCVRK